MQPFVVDLSHHNEVEDFKKVRASGIVGIIHKATQGSAMVDKMYAPRRQAAINAGLLWGAYHFATDEDVTAQLGNFLGASQPEKDTLLCLDWEPYKDHTMHVSQATSFLSALEQRMGRKAVLYSGNLAKEKLGAKRDPFFGNHKLWLAQYGPTPRIQVSWQKYFLWQFTGDGIGPKPHSVPGISTQGIDLNTYGGTPEELAREWAT